MMRSQIWIALAGMALLAGASGFTAASSQPTDALAAQAQEERATLVRAQRAAREAATRSRAMRAEAATLTSRADRDRATRAALGLAVQAAEAEFAAMRAESAIVATAQARQRARLAAQQRPVAELLASLQLLSRRPALAMLLEPGSARQMVHQRAMIEAVVPIVRRRTAALRAELARTRNLAAVQARAQANTRASAERLANRRAELARSEAAGRAEATRIASTAALENDRATVLAEDADSIGTLLESLEDDGARRDRLARLAGPVARPGSVGNDAPRTGLFGLGSRTSQPAYRLPVVGRVVTGFGEASADGVRSRGLTIAARGGAQALAPAQGRISYAGSFRSYGRIVIVDHGGGWTSLITGLLTVSVRAGDRVEQGSPIGRVGPNAPRIGIELRRAGQPIDVAALAS